MTNAGCRIARTRLKAGGLVVHFNADAPAERARRAAIQRRDDIIRQIEGTVAAQGSDLDGFALVVWGAKTGSTAQAWGSDNVPNPLVPEYVKTRLELMLAERWTLQTLNGENVPPDPDLAS